MMMHGKRSTTLQNSKDEVARGNAYSLLQPSFKLLRNSRQTSTLPHKLQRNLQQTSVHPISSPKVKKEHLSENPASSPKSLPFQVRLDSETMKMTLSEFIRQLSLSRTDFENLLNPDPKYLRVKTRRTRKISHQVGATNEKVTLFKVKAQDAFGRVLKISSYHMLVEEERPTQCVTVVKNVHIRSEVQLRRQVSHETRISCQDSASSKSDSEHMVLNKLEDLRYWCIFEIEREGFTDEPALPWRSAFSDTDCCIDRTPIEIGHARGKPFFSLFHSHTWETLLKRVVSQKKAKNPRNLTRIMSLGFELKERPCFKSIIMCDHVASSQIVIETQTRAALENCQRQKR